MKATYWRRSRQAVQALSFCLFVALVVYTTWEAGSALQADAILRLDPLAALAAMLASRRWLARFIPALVVMGATLILGRFWCGWLCPLGTLLDWLPGRAQRKTTAPLSWRAVKYSLLFLILFAALWGNLTLLILDPLTIFVRSVSTLVLPALNWLITQAEFALYRVPFLRGGVDLLDSALQGTVLRYEQAYFGGGLLLAALLGGILALNLIARRAWCRFLCPLGGLLSLVAKGSWLKRKVSPACVSCGVCARACRMGTIDADKGYASDSGECVLCLDCAVDCPSEAISFGPNWRFDRGWAYDPSRRQALGALGASLGGLALLRIAPSAAHPDPSRLRPPGAQEERMLSSCIRCGACVRVCPTQGLQPSVTQAGLEGVWTPILVPRLGHCEYSCTSCGEICPTGAIPQLSLEEKHHMPIGKAYIDPKLCIAWSGRGPCIVCEEMCPLPDKAITLRDADESQGAMPGLQLPVVLHERCIGCGLCENKCPVNGEAAIRVIVDPMA